MRAESRSSPAVLRNAARLTGGLLFSEVCLLAGMAGILAWRYPAPGIFCFCLLLWLDAPRKGLFARAWGNALALLLCFLCFICYAALRETKPPPTPDWLARTVAASAPVSFEGEVGPNTWPVKPELLEVSARAADCTPLPGGRLRVVLTDVAPVGAEGVDLGAQPGKAAEKPASYAGGVVWTWSAYDPRENAILPGQRLRLSLRFMPLRSFANPGLWGPESYWNDKGVFYRATAPARSVPAASFPLQASQGAGPRSLENMLADKRQHLLQGFLAALPQEGAGLGVLPALVFGDRSLLSAEQTDLFARSTLAHSLALSGLHMGFALLAGLTLAWGAGVLFPSLLLRAPRPGLALLFSLPFALVYLWLGQSPVSLQRAACMLFFWTLLFFLKRPKALQDGLFAALALILAINPFALFELGLQLSALCIAVLALCLPGVLSLSAGLFPHEEGKGRLAGAANRLLRGAFVIFCTSLCIQAALLPLTARVFGSSGLLFPLNVLWLPVVGAFILPLAFMGLLASALGLGAAASALLHAAALPCQWLLALLELLDDAGLLLSPLLPRPHWISSLGCWLLILALSAFVMHLRRERKKSAAAREEPEKVGGPRPESYRHKEQDERGTGSLGGSGQGFLFGAGVPLVQVGFGLCLLLAPPVMALLESGKTAVQVKLLDVGQGQSVLVEWSGLGGERSSGRALIDGGGLGSQFFDVGKAVAAPLLTDNRLPRLDAVINSHPDRDHLEGLLFIIEHFRVGRCFGNGDSPTAGLAKRAERALARGGKRMETLRAGNSLELAPGLRLETLWAPAETAGEGKSAAPLSPGNRDAGREANERNDNSLVLRLVWQGKGLVLIPGDLGKRPLRSLAKRNGPDLSAQALILPHHGSVKSLAPSFYDKVNPGVALASCGAGNAWRYPALSVVEALRKRGTEVHSTAGRGQIVLRWTSPEAAPEKKFALPAPVSRSCL